MALPSRRVRLTRNTVLFVVGLAGVAHETLVTNADRPTLLLLFAAMIGLPAFIGADERTQALPPSTPAPQTQVTPPSPTTPDVTP